MTIDKDEDGPAKAAPRDHGGDRKAKLAEQLRANLQRRKAQARSRRAGEADQRPEGLAGTRPDSGPDRDGGREG